MPEKNKKMKILEKTMEQMPKSFTSNEFNKKAISNGYPKTLLQSKGLSTFIRKYADNAYKGSKTWVKSSANEKKEDRQYSFATFDEIISFLKSKKSFLKSKGYKIMENEKISKVTETQQLNRFVVNTRLFGVYDRGGNIKSVCREPCSAFEEATKLNRQLGNDEYFIDWVIVG